MVTSIEWLMELDDRGILFLRDPSHRVLHVVAPGWIRDATLRVVANLGNRPEGRGPVFVIDAADGDGALGWGERARQLRELATAGDGKGHERASESAPNQDGLVTFAEQLIELAHGHHHEDGEVVVALAPAPIRARERWDQALSLLLGSELLRFVRWIVVDADAASSEWRNLPDGAVLSCRAPIGLRPAAAPGAALERSRARHGGSGAVPAGVLPPPRGGRGQAPAVEDDGARAIAGHVLAASTAMERQRTAEAIEQQCRARDLAVDAQRVDQIVVMELILAGYLLTASAATQAISSCERAAVVAKDAQLHELAAVALLTLGTCRMVRGDMPGALVAFAEGAACADLLPSVPLAIEACRLTGEVALALGMEGQAVSFWARAIKRGKEDSSLAPQVAGSVARCALRLDRLCKERGVKPPAEQEASLPVAATVEPRPVQGAQTERLRGWTSKELQSLRQSWRSVLDDDTTSLLLPDELASIHGWKELPAPRRVVSGTLVLVSSPLDRPEGTEVVRGRTERLDPVELAAIRRRLRGGVVERSEG